MEFGYLMQLIDYYLGFLHRFMHNYSLLRIV